MIAILKRYDLPEEHRRLAVEDLELGHFQLSPQVIEQAELIVLVEGSYIKYLKHHPEIQFTDNFEVLSQYITSISFNDRPRWRVKRFGHRREKR